ncbi:delta-like protein C [Betta splendens]|uniref:Delta-like protein n=1 Tax=Betta splendens TaxID=158456 RepID=A0A6P7P7U5_BETSP|nr:delta-like protein C [Betta splendens]
MERFLLCFLLFGSAPTVLSSGVFELKVESFTTSRGVCSFQPRDCRVFFRACLKHSQDVINPEPPCTYGTALTDIFGADSISVSESAPIKVPFHFKWPGNFSLILEAWNAESSGLESKENQNNLLVRVATRRRLSIGEDWSQDAHVEAQSELRFSYRVVCEEHYHGAACAAYCRPRNDTFGHFTCDAEGRRRCLEGWSGEYCAEPICPGGCSDKGFCEAPGACVCQQGWQGERCQQCARHPGCLHGTCQQPWQCNCREGWGGLYCDQDLNYCTNHKPCQNGASCTNTGQGSYTCACRPGFAGVNCEVQSNECDSGPCRNGGSCTDLQSDYSCACPQGFYGKNCEVSAMTCADGPCFNGGSCLEGGAGGYSCRCPHGFTGSNCERRTDRCSSSPCANGAQCLDLGSRVVCRCRPGFTGPRCDTSMGACASHPCRNAGTCEERGSDFACSCALGFEGKDCSTRTCERFPCSNGGTCFTLFTGPVCRCPPGFTGARCEAAPRTTSTSSSSTTTAALPPPVTPPPALIAAIVFGSVTLVLLVCAAAHVLRQLRRGRELRALSTSVKNDLEMVNNRSAVVGGGGPNKGLPGAALSLKEKEAFLNSAGPLKVSNKDAALAEKGGNSMALFKNKMADCNLVKEEQHLDKNTFEHKKCDSFVVVPPRWDSVYHPVFIIPEQMEQRVFATEV